MPARKYLPPTNRNYKRVPADVTIIAAPYEDVKGFMVQAIYEFMARENLNPQWRQVDNLTSVSVRNWDFWVNHTNVRGIREMRFRMWGYGPEVTRQLMAILCDQLATKYGPNTGDVATYTWAGHVQERKNILRVWYYSDSTTGKKLASKK